MKKNKKIVKEFLFEKFKQDSDPVSDMGIGIISKIKQDLKDHNIEESNVKITNECEIYWVGSSYYKPNVFQELQLKYLSPKKREFVKTMLDIYKTGPSHELIEKCLQSALDSGLQKSDIKMLVKEFTNKSVLTKVDILLHKLTRDKNKKNYEDNINIYIFIGYIDKVPITINGKQYYEDRLEAESMVKIDKYNINDLQSIHMMKMRANIQYGNQGSYGTYMVHIPKFMMDEYRYDDIPDEHREFIEKHKQSI